EALETLEKVDTLVIDKTGTLTEGKPRVTAFSTSSPLGEFEVLRLAASVEQGSEHPFASAIVAAARDHGMRLSPVQNFESHAGKGVTGVVEDKQIAIGTFLLMKEQGIEQREFSLV